jgi:tetratricopeptide (TPR) repeat protein
MVPDSPRSSSWRWDRDRRDGRGDRDGRRRDRDWNDRWRWGYWLGTGYWGFGNPYWYGGYPFYYSPLAYGSYWNPYYSEPFYAGGYDYGVPIQQYQVQGQAVQPMDDSQAYTSARAAFYNGDYQQALQYIQQAIKEMPRDRDVHQLYALILFALGDDRQAAAVAHTVLEDGPGWNWEVVQRFYPLADVYTRQLRNLEQSIATNDSAAARFLLAYHYLMLGHLDSAERQLQRVVALEPRDKLAANLVAGLRGQAGAAGSAGAIQGNQAPAGPPEQAPVSPPTQAPLKAPPEQPQAPANPPQGPPEQAGQAPAQPSGPEVRPAGPPRANELVGSWTATPAPEVHVGLTLQPDGKFTWTFKEGDQKQSFAGQYELKGDTLVLTRQDGQKMDANVKMQGDRRFNFRLKQADSKDPGLEFVK